MKAEHPTPLDLARTTMPEAAPTAQVFFAEGIRTERLRVIGALLEASRASTEPAAKSALVRFAGAMAASLGLKVHVELAADVNEAVESTTGDAR